MTIDIKSRRYFLGGCLSVLGTIFAGGIIYPIVSFLLPQSQKGKKEIVKISKDKLPLGGMERFRIRDIPAVVINSKSGYAAFSLVCPHLGCLVTWEGERNQFLCPCHGAIFDEDGNVIAGPPPRGLEPLKIEEKEMEVWIS
jgi:cytochrome b6-f complex iron-sulfur subunit